MLHDILEATGIIFVMMFISALLVGGSPLNDPEINNRDE